jgi:laccase
VEYGKTYLLRIINAALTNELFFAIAKHTLTVVEVVAVYTKPFATTSIMITPGQTTTVLMTANKVPDFTGMFVMAARPYLTSVFPSNNSTTIGFLRYKNARTWKGKSPVDPSSLKLHNLPAMEDTAFATKFSDKIKSLASPQYPCNVPKTIDKRVITTISLNLQDCPENKTCLGYKGKSFFASMNNQSFVRPSISILESYYKNLTTSSFSSDFPQKPPNNFDSARNF